MRSYKHKASLRTHQRFECGKEPQFKCPFCRYSAKRKTSLKKHLSGHCPSGQIRRF